MGFAQSLCNTHCYIYNDRYEKIGYVDDNESDRNFYIMTSVYEGDTIYLKVGSPAFSATGTFVLSAR